MALLGDLDDDIHGASLAWHASRDSELTPNALSMMSFSLSVTSGNESTPCCTHT